MIGFLSSALKLSRMEQNLKLKSIESQPILACSYISIVILTNAIKTLYLRQCYIALMRYLPQPRLLMKNAPNGTRFLAVLITL